MPNENIIKAAGIRNEHIFIKEVNRHIKDNGGRVTLILKAGTKTLRIIDAKEAKSVGANTSNRKKSDVNIITHKKQIIPLSIKMDNAQIWESADSYFGKKAKRIIEKNVDKGHAAINPVDGMKNVYKIEPNIAVEANNTEKKNVVFGSDILLKKGAIIKKTFKPVDFKYQQRYNTLTIKVTSLIKRMADLKNTKDDVWFLMRNDTTRKSKTIGIHGLRTLAVYKGRINRQVKQVKR